MPRSWAKRIVKYLFASASYSLFFLLVPLVCLWAIQSFKAVHQIIWMDMIWISIFINRAPPTSIYIIWSTPWANIHEARALFFSLSFGCWQSNWLNYQKPPDRRNLFPISTCMNCVIWLYDYKNKIKIHRRQRFAVSLWNTIFVWLTYVAGKIACFCVCVGASISYAESPV